MNAFTENRQVGNRLSNKFCLQPFSKNEYVLLFSLMAFLFIPSINQLVIDKLITGMNKTDITIASQIEWFDLFNETLLAFLTVPMFSILNKAQNNDIELIKRINNTFLAAFCLYLCVSAFIYYKASNLALFMKAPQESITYLKLETLGFILSFIGSYI